MPARFTFAIPCCAGLVTMASASGAAAADDVRHLPQPGGAAECLTSDTTPLDPAAMFDRVVARYQELSTYEDSVTVEQVTARSGEPAVRNETRITCAIDTTGELAITTASEQAAGGLGRLFGDAFAPAPPDAEPESEPESNPESDRSISDASASDYDFWLAPHMGLRYSKSPLEDFRAGIDEGFTAVKAERVTVEDAEMVRLDLQSGDGLSGDYRAKFELFIDPATLLITRIRGTQVLPDGANLLTDFVIRLRSVVTADGAELAPLASQRRGAAT